MTTRRKTAGKQRLYKMRGCNKKGCKKTMRRSRKYRGGSKSNMAYLGGKLDASAYPNPGPAPGGFNFLNPQSTQRGGCNCGSMNGGSNTFVGSPWTPASSGWPGIQGSGNHYELNKFPVDPQTSIINTGANKPFMGGRKRKQKGGNLSNFLSQDLINLGRQFQFGVGTAYNGLSGYPAPVNPLPWKGQMSNTPNLATVKAML